MHCLCKAPLTSYGHSRDYIKLSMVRSLVRFSALVWLSYNNYYKDVSFFQTFHTSISILVIGAVCIWHFLPNNPQVYRLLPDCLALKAKTECHYFIPRSIPYVLFFVLYLPSPLCHRVVELYSKQGS